MRRVVILVVAAWFPAWIGQPERANAQAADPVGDQLGLSRESGSLPIWTAPNASDVAQLGEMARSMRQSVMLVGTAKAGHGTAFVISEQQRLLATSAHVADILHRAGKMLAIVNEDTKVYEVQRVWYHPGLLRVIDESTRAVGRSTDPAAGDVEPRSPDIAVMELKAGGPDLPPALRLAGPDQIADVFAKTVALVGFPAHDTAGWPGLGERPQATFHNGVISRMTDFQLDGSVPAAERQMLQHTAIGLGGFGGSPIFLPDGSVVGVHNGFRRVVEGDVGLVLSHGVRIDCLWELLAYHELTQRMSIPVERAECKLERFSQPDAKVKQYQRANRLAAEARVLIDLRKFAEGSAKAMEALKSMPDHPEALYQRSRASTNYQFTYEKRISSTVRRQQLAEAEKYAKRLAQAAPSDPKSALTLLMSMTNTAAEKHRMGNRNEAIRDQQMVLDAANRLLASGKLVDNWNRAFAYSVRSSANSNLVLNRGGRDLTAALSDNREAIRLNPEAVSFVDARVQLFELMGRSSEARQWRRKAEELRAKIERESSAQQGDER